MANKVVKRNILIDEPAGEDAFRGRGHERIADALATAIKNFRNKDRAIGLDGPWGSGKSSVVEIAKLKLMKESGKDKARFHFFTFDIWNSQGSPFRRSFLEHFLDWSIATFPQKVNELSDVEKRVKGKIREVDSDNQFMLGWYGIGVLFVLPFLPIYYFWAKDWFDAFAKVNKELLFLASWPFLILISAIILTFFVAFRRFLLSIKGKNFIKNAGENLRIAFSQTLLINAKQYEKQKVTQYIREIDPNDFEFQTTFREILALIQSDHDRIVVVLDNIDRLPKDEIPEYWAFVRAVFSQHPFSKAKGSNDAVVAIVPYDRHHIGAAVDVEVDNGVAGKISALSSREIFSKTFDEVLSVSPPVMSNSRDFFQEKIAGALVGFSDSDALFRVYLIFNKILQVESGQATPRQIIAFINELTSRYVLHNGQFGLSTIAVYIAYQDALESKPLSLTNPHFIDERIKSLAADPDLERNLAALIFNVEANLAFQILLDDQIKVAASNNITGPLTSISLSPGFDLRVNEVIQENLKEWISGGEFYNVIKNFSALYERDQAGASRECAKSLLEGISQLASIDLVGKRYLPYLDFYKICREQDISTFSRQLVTCVSKGLSSQKGVGQKDGQALVEFLGDMQNALRSAGASISVEDFLSSISPPQDAAFMMGLAAALHRNGMSLRGFSNVEMMLPEEGGFLEQFAISQPEVAVGAFPELQAAGLIGPDDLIVVGNKLVEELTSDEPADSGKIGGQVSLLRQCWMACPAPRKTELKIAEIFESVAFFENASGLVGDALESNALSDLLVLAGPTALKVGFEVPTTDNGNAEPHAGIEAAERFRLILDGSLNLPASQISRLAEMLKKALQVTSWAEIGAKEPQNSFISSVVLESYRVGALPDVSLKTFTETSGYLKNISGSEWLSILDRYGARLDEKQVSYLKIDLLPLGILSDTAELIETKWHFVHDKVTNLLDEISTADWIIHLENADVTLKVLLEKVSASGYISSSPAFRDGFFNYVNKVLNNGVVPKMGNLGKFMKCIATEFHSDFYRRMRESLKSVSIESLQNGFDAFPEIISGLIEGGDRMKKNEKDAIVRHVISIALEGQLTGILNICLNMPRTKIIDYVKQSELATQDYWQGALNQFSRNCRDLELVRRVGEMVHGKKKLKSWLEIWLSGLSGEGSSN